MPPPPKPPVICYDLQTNANARRTPCSRYRVSAIAGTSYKSKVTVISTEQSDLTNQLKTDTCWHHSYEHEADDEYENSHRVPIAYPGVSLKKWIDPPKQHSKQQTKTPNHLLKHRTDSYHTSRPSSQDQTLAQTRRQQVRYEYDQKLKEKLRQKERLEERRRQEEEMRAELEKITLRLESVKKVHANLKHTYGMSHNAARYFQKTDEDYAHLKQKLDQFAQNRSRDAERQLQQKKKLYKYQQQEDKEAELKRLRGMSRLAHNERNKLTSTLNGSLSPSSLTPASSITSTARHSPSSTISISTCSSPFSSSEELPKHNLSHHNSQFVVKTSPSKKCPVSPSTPSSSKTPNRYQSSTLKTQAKRPVMDFSFYKGPPQDSRETLEVTDSNFLEMVEDKTMLEVNELLNKMQSVLGDSYDEQCLYNETGDISKLRSQVDNLAIRTPDIANYCNQSYLD